MVVLRASITSFIPPSATRCTRLSIWRSLGPTPSIGEITPPSTRYNPRNSWVPSTAITSRIFSTTQIVEASRAGLAQIWQVSVSDILWHTWQYFTSRFNVIIEFPKASTVALSCRSRWSTSLIAVFRPIPGSLENSPTAFSSSTEGYCWFIYF